MLDIVLSATDDLPVVKLTFEHSLVSLSKWESLYERPFYSSEAKDKEETKTYIRLMLLTEDAPVNFLDRINPRQMQELAAYINSKQSATTFGFEPKTKGGPTEIVTAELIYYWMVQFTIPLIPTETWHLNRLMTLIKIASIKQSKPKPMNKQQQAERYRQLNEQRRRESGSAG